nr:MAG TPA: hypothetical protein [Caudoviricetes sp.]
MSKKLLQDFFYSHRTWGTDWYSVFRKIRAGSSVYVWHFPEIYKLINLTIHHHC